MADNGSMDDIIINIILLLLLRISVDENETQRGGSRVAVECISLSLFVV